MVEKSAFFLALGCVVFFICANMPFMAFLSFHAFLLALLLPMGMTFAVHGYEKIRKALQYWWTETDSGKDSLEVVQTFDQATILAGLLALTSGILMMFALIDTPSAIGPNFSLAIHGSLYALVISRCILFPIQLVLRKRLGFPRPSSGDQLLNNFFLLIFPLANYLCFLVVVFSIMGKGETK